jgi:hypothetical protein
MVLKLNRIATETGMAFKRIGIETKIGSELKQNRTEQNESQTGIKIT